MTSEFAMWFSQSISDVSRATYFGKDHRETKREEALRLVMERFGVKDIGFNHPAVDAIILTERVMTASGSMYPAGVAEIFGHMLRAWEEYQKLEVSLRVNG